MVWYLPLNMGSENYQVKGVFQKHSFGVVLCKCLDCYLSSVKV